MPFPCDSWYAAALAEVAPDALDGGEFLALRPVILPGDTGAGRTRFISRKPVRGEDMDRAA